jgi:predicted phage tail protein
VTVVGYFGDYTMTQTLPSGTYYIRARSIHALGAQSAWSLVRSVSYRPVAPPLAPASVIVQEDNTTRMPFVSWPSVAGAQMYHIRFGTFNPPLKIYSTTATSYQFPTPLPYGAYTFQVRTVDARGQVSAWMEVPFYVSADSGLTAPLLNRMGPTVELRWTPRSQWGYANYELQLSQYSSFPTEARLSIRAVAAYTTLTDLDEGTWYWRVKEWGGVSFSPVYSFSIVAGE